MDNPERTVTRFRLQLALLLVLKYATSLLTGWAFLWGTGVLVLRVQFNTPEVALLWGFAGIPVAVGLAAFLAWRRLPPVATVRSLLDRQNGCGGLLMAADEVGLGNWSRTLPALATPRLHWQGGRRAAILLTAAAAFVTLSFLMPTRMEAQDPSNPFEVGRDVAKLARQLAALKEQGILDPERVESLMRKLDRVLGEAKGTDPVKTLEPLTHLSEIIQKTAHV